MPTKINLLCCSITIELVASLLLFMTELSFADAGAVLKTFESLSGKEREAKLIEEAKREGKLVYYGTIAIDQSTPLMDAFKKQYPFLKTEYYRSGNVNVYNKIRTEARANNNIVDVIDLRAGETYALVKEGLIDPYLSPSRNGIMPEFMEKKGYWTAPFHSPMALAYNTNFVKKEEAPRSYDDLINSKWKGKMSLDVEDADMMGTLIEYWGRDKGMGYFRKLAENATFNPPRPHLSSTDPGSGRGSGRAMAFRLPSPDHDAKGRSPQYYPIGARSFRCQLYAVGEKFFASARCGTLSGLGPVTRRRDEGFH